MENAYQQHGHGIRFLYFVVCFIEIYLLHFIYIFFLNGTSTKSLRIPPRGRANIWQIHNVSYQCIYSYYAVLKSFDITLKLILTIMISFGINLFWPRSYFLLSQQYCFHRIQFSEVIRCDCAHRPFICVFLLPIKATMATKFMILCKINL